MPSADLILAPFDCPGQDPARSLSFLDFLPAKTHPTTAPNKPFGLKMTHDPFQRTGFCHRQDLLTGQRGIQYP